MIEVPDAFAIGLSPRLESAELLEHGYGLFGFLPSTGILAQLDHAFGELQLRQAVAVVHLNNTELAFGARGLRYRILSVELNDAACECFAEILAGFDGKGLLPVSI